MKIIVTGGLGFQGSHLAERLVRDGHEVTVLNTPSARARDRHAVMTPAPARTVWGSVTDPEVVRKAVAGQDAVIHLAAWTHVDESIARPWWAWRVNAEGTYHVLEAAREAGARLVLSSSCEVYGSAVGDPVDETAVLRPKSPYAAGKVAGDRLAYAYARTYGMPVVILRPANIWGPRQRTDGLIPRFVAAALRGGALTVYGSGSQGREWLYVADVVDGYTAALRYLTRDPESAAFPAGMETFNLGSGEQVSVNALAEQIVATLGGQIVHTEGRPGEVIGFRLDSRRAASVLGWSPVYPFVETFAAYLEGCKEAGRPL